MSGQIPHRSDILSISNSDPCQVITTLENGYKTRDFVRLTNLNGMMPVPHGEDQLNNKRFRIIKTGLDRFTLQNPITFESIDSTNFTPYNTGGFCNRIENNFFYHGDEEEE